MSSRRITVEPTLLLYTVALQITNFVDVNLLLQKACHPDLTGQPEPNLKCADEASAQRVITNINTWKPFLDCTLASLFIIFIGQWSDMHGKRRKPMLIIPIVGEIVGLLASLMCVFLWRLSPDWTALLTVVRSFTGGSACVTAGCIIYISDITTQEERTLRIGLMESAMFLGGPIGNFLAGFLRARINFYGTYIVCIFINVIALLFTVFLVKNSAVQETDLKTCEGTFYPKDLLENISIFGKKREGFGRLVVILTFFVTPLYVASMTGEYSVFYLYARYKFNMGEVEYTNFSFSKRIVGIAGVVPIMILFCPVFKVTDVVFGIIASVVQIISGICNTLDDSRYQLLAFTLMDPMRGIVTVTSRSLLTKVVETSEFGRITSLQTALETFIPIFAIPMYSRIYQSTVEFMPGAFFLLNSCIAVVLLIFFIIIFFIERRRTQVNDKSDIKSSEATNTEGIPDA